MKEKQSILKNVYKRCKMLGLALMMTFGAVGCSQTQTDSPKKTSSGARPTVSYQRSTKGGHVMTSAKKSAGQEWRVQSSNQYSTPRRTSYHQSQKDEGILQMGVLLPNPGENAQEYEARRERMESASRALNAQKAELYYRQWMQLKSEGANKRLVAAAAKAYADAKAGAEMEIISCNSARGRKILQEGNGTNRYIGQTAPVVQRASRDIADF